MTHHMPRSSRSETVRAIAWAAAMSALALSALMFCIHSDSSRALPSEPFSVSYPEAQKILDTPVASPTLDGVPVELLQETTVQWNVDIHSGMGISVLSMGEYKPTRTRCTLGPVIDDTRGLAARHCVHALPALITPADSSAIIGIVTALPAADVDSALVKFFDRDSRVTVDDLTLAPLREGQIVNKTGDTSGTTYGPVTAARRTATLDKTLNTPAYEAEMCVRHGDSGGPVRNEKGEVVGLVSYSTRGEGIGEEECPEGEVHLGFVPLFDALRAARQ